MAYLVARPRQGVRVPVLRWAGSGRVVGPVQGIGGVCCVKKNGRWFARNPYRPNELCPTVTPPPGVQGLGAYYHTMPGGDVCRCGPPGMQGLGQAWLVAQQQALETAKMGLFFNAAQSAEQLVAASSSLITPAGERVRRARADNFVPGSADMKTLAAQRAILEAAKQQLSKLVNAFGYQGVGFLGSQPWEKAVKDAARHLDAWATQAADFMANTFIPLPPAWDLSDPSTFHNLLNDPIWDDAGARFEAFMQGWAGATAKAADLAANVAKDAADAAKSGSAAMKNTADAAKQAADTLKDLAKQPGGAAGVLGGLGLLGLGVLAVVLLAFTGRK